MLDSKQASFRKLLLVEDVYKFNMQHFQDYEDIVRE